MGSDCPGCSGAVWQCSWLEMLFAVYKDYFLLVDPPPRRWWRRHASGVWRGLCPLQFTRSLSLGGAVLWMYRKWNVAGKRRAHSGCIRAKIATMSLCSILCFAGSICPSTHTFPSLPPQISLSLFLPPYCTAKHTHTLCDERGVGSLTCVENSGFIVFACCGSA